MSSVRVQIIGDHPHVGEYGTIELNEDNTITLNSLRMAKIELENCPHGTEACYAQSQNVKREPECGHSAKDLGTGYKDSWKCPVCMQFIRGDRK